MQEMTYMLACGLGQVRHMLRLQALEQCRAYRPAAYYTALSAVQSSAPRNSAYGVAQPPA